MIKTFRIEDVIASPSKVAILRIFASREGLQATGRQIAKLAGFSVPAIHDSLKSLHARNILNLDIIGKQHVYTLNENERMVQKIIRPMFAVEGSVKNDIREFLLHELKKAKELNKITALIFYGSMQTGKDEMGSDVDIAVIVKQKKSLQRVENVFVEMAPKFKRYFGVELDPYIKTEDEFRAKLKKNRPPVSTLMLSYSVLFGKEPLEI